MTGSFIASGCKGRFDEGRVGGSGSKSEIGETFSSFVCCTLGPGLCSDLPGMQVYLVRKRSVVIPPNAVREPHARFVTVSLQATKSDDSCAT
jgi:hypothetical protein